MNIMALGACEVDIFLVTVSDPDAGPFQLISIFRIQLMFPLDEFGPGFWQLKEVS